VYDGYMALGLPGAETPVINNALTSAIARAWGFNVTASTSCTPVQLNILPNGLPDLTAAPWYDPALPESAEFAGCLGLQIGGTGKFPGVRSPMRVNSAGAQLGRIQQSYREIVVNGYLIAASQRGLSYGLAWLTSQLRGTCLPAAGCGTAMSSTIWTDCNINDTTGRRQLFNVGLLQGPEQTSKANPRFATDFSGTNCDGMAFWGGDVVFTIAAGWPWLYLDPVPIAPALPFIVPAFWPCDAVWVPEGTSGTTPPSCSDSALAHCVQWTPNTASACTAGCPGTIEGGCMQDPNCPASTSPPTPPMSSDPCVCLATVQPLVATAQVNQGQLPAFAEVVPVVQVTAGEQDMRRLLISFYASTPGASCNFNQLDQCALIGQIGIPRIPAGTVLTIDGRTQSALISCPDGTLAQPVLYSDAGPAITWPVLSCGTAWCVSATVDESYVDTVNASLGISLVARQDAG
jgi:hypothetical protein